MDPPSYEEIEKGSSKKSGSWNSGEKFTTRLSLRDEVFESRMQHVAALVGQLLPHIRARAQRGLSKTSLLILPSDTISNTRGKLVGFPEDKMPIIIQLEGGYDGTEFWTQEEVRSLLQEQTLAAVQDQVPKTDAVEDLPLPVCPEPEPKRSFWARKQSKAPVSMTSARPSRPPVTVKVVRDEFSFREQTRYGLFETLRARAVLLSVEVE